MKEIILVGKKNSPDSKKNSLLDDNACSCESNRESIFIEESHKGIRLLNPPPSPNEPWVGGVHKTRSGSFKKINAELSFSDYWGEFKSGISAFRIKYTGRPSLYAIGEPDLKANVFAFFYKKSN